ncbi:MAG: S-adenosyl-L-homocysteine hydrolase [Pseudomonadota bacterium]
MKFKAPIAAACALAAALTAGTAHADDTSSSAANLRKLDIMLMVTSLRCRSGEHDFQADYHRFAAKHLGSLNEANKQLRRSLVARHGAKGSKRALDRIGVIMANTYGDGHPWMGCAELKQVARDLSAEPDSSKLYDAAKRLLAPTPETPVVVAAAKPRPQVTPRKARILYEWPGSRPLVATYDD